jgi:hypothetical protein
MKRCVVVAVSSALIACSSQQGRPPEHAPSRGHVQHVSSFHLPTPPGWQIEIFPFPLEFAPSLPYLGVEELRLAPGFFDAGAPGFWSYVFVWYLEGDVPFTAAGLAKDLETYYEGLAKSRESPALYDPIKAAAHATLGEGKPVPQGFTHYEGAVDIHDPFTTHARLTLRVKLDVLCCRDEGRTAVLSRASPQPPQSPVWAELAGIASGFRCSRVAPAR